MPRHPRREIQLDFPWTDLMRWAELPVAVRDRVRERLTVLLREAAQRARAAQEGRDEPA